MNNRKMAAVSATLLLFGAAGCQDLTVPNVNEPQTQQVLARPADVEQLIVNSYLSWWDATSGKAAGAFDPGIYVQLQTMSFENSAMAANFGMIERSRLPRAAINNNPADAFASQLEGTWYGLYRSLKAASDGVRQIDGGVVIGTTANTMRAKTFAKFVQGLSHGALALTYDQAFVLDETTPLPSPGTPTPDLQPYSEVMEAALGYLDEAIALAGANTFTTPTGWINGVTLTNVQLAALARSYKARFRAEVARNPAERAAVNWAAVVADVDAGRQTDFEIEFDDVNWRYTAHIYGSFGGAWHQSANQIIGMADQSGAFQTWINTPLASRDPFLIITPDQRFPQGATGAAQAANPGEYLIQKGTSGHVRPDRGTWRWSFYRDNRFAHFYPDWSGFLPELTRAEMQLLKAEGLFRTGDAAGAATIINTTRTTTGGMQAVSAGAPNPDCVPKLPDGTCGNFLEVLKWEKRLETWASRYGAWFFDSRGWGDLPQGTIIHFPVPARELLVLQLPVYNTGGVGLPGGAAQSTYGY
ncbi:MAG: hypothetical protein H0X65_03235 [Gemmatimonadetes bacterium]|nr:hypothetical protein [Gemmatimonadota bacterium]